MQSESPSEVVVLLGATTTSVPTDQIQSIRYDGQSASFQLAEAREVERATGRGGRAVQESRDRVGRQAVSASGGPVSRGRGPDRAGHGRAGPRQGSEGQAHRGSCRPIPPAATWRRRAPARLASNCIPATSPGPRPPSPTLAKLPEGAERAAVLRTRILGKQGKHAEAITQLDKLIAGYPKGSERQRAALLAKAENLAAMKQFTEAETLLARGDRGEPARRRGRPGPRLQHPGRLPPRGQSSQGRPVRLSAHRPALQQSPRKSIPAHCTTSSSSIASSNKMAAPTSLPSA